MARAFGQQEHESRPKLFVTTYIYIRFFEAQILGPRG